MNDLDEELFGQSVAYLRVLEECERIYPQHEYHFYPDEWFKNGISCRRLSIAEANRILASEILDKAHLVAMIALMRTQKWLDGVRTAYATDNFLSWTASARALMESCGDVLDAMLNVSSSLGGSYDVISNSLNGTQHDALRCYGIEKSLDHFLHAKWGRGSGVEVAKENIEYVRPLERAGIIGAEKIYRRLSHVAHPSSAFMESFLNTDPLSGSRLTPHADKNLIRALLREFGAFLGPLVQISCNPPLLTLRVLHEFGKHPPVPGLEKLRWDNPIWRELSRRFSWDEGCTG